jgi:nucleotidyltransferase substrate binding protein (TIGR01987 family)
MERTQERLAVARRALGTLDELITEGLSSAVVRDAAIQRFEYTFEAVWKAAQMYLREIEGLVIGSPKGVVRLSRQVGILDEDDGRLALAMSDDRNLTVHAYNEAVAEAISKRLKDYARLTDRWLRTMTERLDASEPQPNDV